jgi:hypothetical protein
LLVELVRRICDELETLKELPTNTLTSGGIRDQPILNCSTTPTIRDTRRYTADRRRLFDTMDPALKDYLNSLKGDMAQLQRSVNTRLDAVMHK